MSITDEAVPKKKKKRKTYSQILRAGYPHLPKDQLYGAQEVPMDINAIDASMAQTLIKKE